MRPILSILPAVALGFGMALLALPSNAQTTAAATPAPAVTPPPLDPIALAAGKADYERWCTWCHGDEGDGHGISAKRLDPHPRDFTGGSFKCRTTATGEIPTDADLRAVIHDGMHAAAMPSWSAIGDQQIADLVVYVKHFSVRFATEVPPPPLEIPPEPPADAASIARGAEVYKKATCVSCHGPKLHGNGPSSHTLKDDDGFPIQPADLTRAATFKCGSDPKRLYITLVTGMNGTPMPSHVDMLSAAEIWDVVHFLGSKETP
jgi:cytochrome c oxidase cbb3-type subunit 2